MKIWLSAAVAVAMLGLTAPHSPVLAQQKTVKACQEEWRANRADNQAKGITERAYVAQCRAGGRATQPTAAPRTSPTAAPPPAGPSSQKTVKACEDEWRANRAAYQAAKITQRAYVEKCRAGETIALPSPPAAAPAPAPAPATTAAPPSQQPPAARRTPTVGQPPVQGGGQFPTEAQAKVHCPADIVVWANLPTKIYHFAGYKNYGSTKQGAYMCEKEATAQGFRASRTEKRPGA